MYEYFNICCIVVLHSQRTKLAKSIKITTGADMDFSLTHTQSVSSLILEKLSSILSSVLSLYLNKAERKRLMLAHSVEVIYSLNTFPYLHLDLIIRSQSLEQLYWEEKWVFALGKEWNEGT